VGDAGFQRKCMGRMESVANEGRTILFVSHNMGAIRRLCSRAIVIDAGTLNHDGSTESAVDAYTLKQTSCSKTLERNFLGSLTDRILIQRVAINRSNSDPCVSPSAEITFQIEGQCLRKIERVRFSVNVQKDGVRLFTLHDTTNPTTLPPGPFSVSIKIAPYLLRPGRYTIGVGANDGNPYTSGIEWIHANDIANFTISEEWSEHNDFGATGIVNIAHFGKRRNNSMQSVNSK